MHCNHARRASYNIRSDSFADPIAPAGFSSFRKHRNDVNDSMDFEDIFSISIRNGAEIIKAEAAALKHWCS